MRAADEAMEITGATPVAAYLDGAQIIAAARALGADAIHPGYGFLSENAGFARAVREAGLIVRRAVAGSHRADGRQGAGARASSRKHGFPVAPSAIEDDEPATFLERAGAVGFPLLIKPAAGGGGKGMRIVRDAGALEAEIARARAARAQRYFGDGRLYVERYRREPAPHRGAGARRRARQRRPPVRARMLGAAALPEDHRGNAIAGADADERDARSARRRRGIARSRRLHAMPAPSSSSTAAGKFYFLEMNTRLQVEHPVTEMVTGHRPGRASSCASRPASSSRFKQGDIKSQRPRHRSAASMPRSPRARLRCRRPARFSKLRVPHGDGVRFDSGIAEGQQVTAAFDPMLAKLIVHGRDREEASRARRRGAARLRAARLRDQHRLPAPALDHPAFAAGEIHTGFLDAHPEIAAEPPLQRGTLRQAARRRGAVRPGGARCRRRGSGTARRHGSVEELMAPAPSQP